MSEWNKLEVDLSKLLGPVNDVIKMIDSVLAFVIVILNIVSAILDVIKVFLVGLLDPIRAIIEAIIKEIRSIIEDLRQLGVYVCGDWELCTPANDFADLIGGYSAYERRMLGRLLDRSDPNRPDMSSSSAALAAFFYVSSGDVFEIVKMIKSIISFFGAGSVMGKASPYPTPTAPKFVYGTEGAGFGAFRGLAQSCKSDSPLPDTVSVSWSMPSGAGGRKLFTSTPKGFLIHASTIPDGFQVLSLTTMAEASQEVKGLPQIKSVLIDPQTNGPLTLYGGVSDLGTAEDSTDFDAVEKDSAQANALVLKLDQVTPILRPSTLIADGKPLIADTFYAKVPAGSPQALGGGTSFTARFLKSELPKTAKFERGDGGYGAVISGSVEDANSYTFRIRAVAEDYAELFEKGAGTLLAPVSVFSSKVRLFNVEPSSLDNAKGVLLPTNAGKFGDTAEADPNFFSISKAGGPGQALLPSAASKDFIAAVKTAFALAILCRADLTEWVPARPTQSYDPFQDWSKNSYPPKGGLQGLEAGGRALFNKYGVSSLVFRKGSLRGFRTAVNAFTNQLGTDLLEGTPPPDIVIEALLKNENVKKLLGWTWADAGWDLTDLTILESLTDKDQEGGLSPNPMQRGPALPPRTVKLRMAGAGEVGKQPSPKRSPGFMLSPKAWSMLSEQDGSISWLDGDGSADFSPCIFDELGNIEFVRNVILECEDADALLAGAVLVLQFGAAVRPIGDAAWLSVRLLPQGLPALEAILDKVERFLLGLLDGSKGIVDVIIAYIDAIQARIFQLQAFIEAIRALLKQLQLFNLGPFTGLISVENGTDGIITSFLTAENKPSDSASAYGGGVCVVAGGLPSILLEMLFLMLGGTPESGEDE